MMTGKVWQDGNHWTDERRKPSRTLGVGAIAFPVANCHLEPLRSQPIGQMLWRCLKLAIDCQRTCQIAADG